MIKLFVLNIIFNSKGQKIIINVLFQKRWMIMRRLIIQCLIDQIVGRTVGGKGAGLVVAITVAQMVTVATLMEEGDVLEKCLMSSRKVLKHVLYSIA